MSTRSIGRLRKWYDSRGGLIKSCESLNEAFGKRRDASFNNASAVGLVWGAGDHRAIMVLIHHRPPCYASPTPDYMATACLQYAFSRPKSERQIQNKLTQMTRLFAAINYDTLLVTILGIIIDKRSSH